MTVKGEEWRPIKGYEGMYEVSNLGRVKRLPLGKQWPYRQTHNNIRKPKLTRRGYLSVNLSKNNIVKEHLIHRLVAEAFIPNADNLPIINHKDCNPQNNNVDNLEWCSYSYNNTYMNCAQARALSRKEHDPENAVWKRNARLLYKAVLRFDRNGKFLGRYESLTSAARESNESQTSICNCCRGKINNTRNSIWKYEIQ